MKTRNGGDTGQTTGCLECHVRIEMVSRLESHARNATSQVTGANDREVGEHQL
jgi:hypothetical protein